MLDIVIADDDRANLRVLSVFCRERPNLRVRLVESGQEALEWVEQGAVDVLLTDLRMPGMSGEELLGAVKDRHAHIPVVVMTGYGTIEGAVELLHRGAYDYLTKPLTRDVFLHRLDRVVEQIKLAAEVRRLERAVAAGEDTRALIGQSPSMLALSRQLPTIASSDASVVIYGASGTGKEVVARTVHRLSHRRERPFVTVNCGALPEALLESELFGHRKGAFTDAHRDHPGLVGAADGGTLFLDEIGEIAPSVQVKLLRFLENKEYRPVGGTHAQIADVRIIAATNRDLHRAVEEGGFRADLYYRLNVVPLTVPELSERQEDIPLLAQHFLAKFNMRFHKRVRFTAGAFESLQRQRWPGNVRQLENRIEQLVVLSADGTVGADAVEARAGGGPHPAPEGPPSGSGSGPSGPTQPYQAAKAAVLGRFEHRYFTALLEEERGRLKRVAERAGLDRKNLWQILKRNRIDARVYKRR